MQSKLIWKKSLFSNFYRLYAKEGEVGTLKDKSFSQTAYGELNGLKYTFKTKGYFNQRTEIIDDATNKIVGAINYNVWMTKATISVEDKTILWKNDNVWNTKWNLFSTEGIEIKFSGSSTSGEIDSNTDDPLLLLSGLYVSNYYWQVSIAVSIMVFVAIMPTIF